MGDKRDIARVIYVKNPTRRSPPAIGFHLMRNDEKHERNSFSCDSFGKRNRFKCYAEHR